MAAARNYGTRSLSLCLWMRFCSSLPYIVTAELAIRMRHDLQLLCIRLLGAEMKAVCSHRRRDTGRDTPYHLLDLCRPSDGRRARRDWRRRGAQLQRRLPPCVYDERPRLPVGLAVGAADQAPRACDSAHSLTGKERAISRLVAPGSRVTSEPDPTTVSRAAPFIRSEPCVCRRVRGWDLEFESGLLQQPVCLSGEP